MVSSCKSLTYNIYTFFCIIHYTLAYTVTKSITSEKVDSWGFAVQIVKMHLYTFDTRELGGCFYTSGLFSNLTERSDYYSNVFALMWDFGPSGIINQTQAAAVIWVGSDFGLKLIFLFLFIQLCASCSQSIFADCSLLRLPRSLF